MTIQELRDDVSRAADAYAAAVGDGITADTEAAAASVKAAKRALSDGIAAGAEPCPKCQAAPIGMIQPAGREDLEFFEVGCLCQGHRAIGFLPELAVQNWNRGVAGFEKENGEIPDGWSKHKGALCYLVESDAADEAGNVVGTFRFYTADREKAENMTVAGFGRRMRVLRGLDIPPDVLANLAAAQAAK